MAFTIDGIKWQIRQIFSGKEFILFITNLYLVNIIKAQSFDCTHHCIKKSIIFSEHY